MLELVQIANELKEDKELYHFTFEVDELIDVLIYLKEHHHFLFLLDYFIEKKEEDYILRVLLKSLAKEKTLCAQMSFTSSEKVPTITDLWPVASSFESYYSRFFDLQIGRGQVYENPIFDFHKAELSFDLTGQFPSVHFKEKEEVITKISIEKSHSEINDDEEIFHSLKALKTIEKYNHQDTINCEVAYCMVAEKSLGIIIPEKARALRMIFCELQRIILHLEYFIQTHIVLREYQELNFLIGLRRKILDLYLFYTKTDSHPKFNLIGGCLYDLPAGWVPMASETLGFIKKELQKIYHLKMKSSLWTEKFPKHKNSADTLLNWCLSGPNLRASGIHYDLRKNKPYYFYAELDFEVPVGIFGTAYDRFIVRLEEVYQSVKIILQVLDNLPYGDIFASEDFLWPNLKRQLENKEAQKEYAKIIREGQKLGEGRFISMLETARGLNGFFLEVTQDKTLLHYLATQDSSLFSLEATLGGLERSELAFEIQSYGLHPWEITQR